MIDLCAWKEVDDDDTANAFYFVCSYLPRFCVGMQMLGCKNKKKDLASFFKNSSLLKIVKKTINANAMWI